jgi:hypothetical protein
MTFTKKNPNALAGASGAKTSVPASRKLYKENSRHAFLLQFLSFLTSGILPLWGAFIDLRAIAFAVRGLWKREVGDG